MHLELPAHPGGVGLVHLEQVAGEEVRLLAALGAADLDDDVAPLVRVLRQQEQLELLGRAARPRSRSRRPRSGTAPDRRPRTRATSSLAVSRSPVRAPQLGTDLDDLLQLVVAAGGVGVAMLVGDQLRVAEASLEVEELTLQGVEAIQHRTRGYRAVPGLRSPVTRDRGEFGRPDEVGDQGGVDRQQRRARAALEQGGVGIDGEPGVGAEDDGLEIDTHACTPPPRVDRRGCRPRRRRPGRAAGRAARASERRRGRRTRRCAGSASSVCRSQRSGTSLASGCTGPPGRRMLAELVDDPGDRDRHRGARRASWR